MGQHAREIAGVWIVTGDTREGLSGPGIDRIRSNGVCMLQFDDILVAPITELVDLLLQKMLEV